MFFVSRPRLLTRKRAALPSAGRLLVSSLALCVALISLDRDARGDTITFNLQNADFYGLGAASGGLQIDTTAGYVVSGDIVIGGEEFNSLDSQSRGSTIYAVHFIDPSGDSLSLYLPVSTLVGYEGGNICPLGRCNGFKSEIQSSSGDYLTYAGTLNAVPTVTPEPSSFLLLAAGLLSLGGFMRKRLSRSSIRIREKMLTLTSTAPQLVSKVRTISNTRILSLRLVSISLLAATALLLSGPTAHATTITFNLQNADFPPLTAKGNIKIDTATGLVVAGDFVAAGIDFSTFSSQSRQNGFYQVLFTDTSFNDFYLDLPVLNLVGYTGGDICSDVAVQCNGVSSQISYFEPNPPSFVNLIAYTGSLQQVSPAAVTPEPSTLVLLGTGILGVAGTIRRRYVS